MTRQQKIKEIISRLKKLFPDSKIALKYSSPWELFVAVVLSAQTTDKQVNVVTGDLFLKYKSLEDYINTPLEEFQNDIKRIGLYKNKGKNIKLSAEIVYKKYDGKLPDSMENLIKLPGVGRKTANVLLGNIYGKSEGIAVDTHVRRLSRLFGLSKHLDPDKIEKDQFIGTSQVISFSPGPRRIPRQAHTAFGVVAPRTGIFHNHNTEAR